MGRWYKWAALGLAIGIAQPSPGIQAQDVWALTNARIETVTKGSIASGTIIIRNGVIEAVGPNVAVPPDARVVDLSNKTVYPGFIDLTSTIGLPEPPRRPAGNPFQGGGGGGGGGGSDTNEPRFIGLEAHRLVAGELRPALTDLRAARDRGITSALVAPDRGLFRGLSALIPMRDDTATHWIVKSPVALHVGYDRVQGRYPGSLLGVIAYQRQQFYDAQRHAQLVERSQTNGGGPRPSYDSDLDALVPVVRGDLPTFIAASNENEIRRAVALGKEFGLKLSVVGATEGFRALDALKGARTVVVSVDFPEPAEVTGWSYRGATRIAQDDSATRATAAKKVLETNAATLNSAGVPIALASGGLRPAQFIANVRKAIAAGLPRNVALEALTIRAAEAAGVEKQLGSIETGKIANLIVTNGELLTDGARLESVFVDGERYPVVVQADTTRNQQRGARRPGTEE